MDVGWPQLSLTRLEGDRVWWMDKVDSVFYSLSALPRRKKKDLKSVRGRFKLSLVEWLQDNQATKTTRVWLAVRVFSDTLRLESKIQFSPLSLFGFFFFDIREPNQVWIRHATKARKPNRKRDYDRDKTKLASFFLAFLKGDSACWYGRSFGLYDPNGNKYTLYFSGYRTYFPIICLSKAS